MVQLGEDLKLDLHDCMQNSVELLEDAITIS